MALTQAKLDKFIRIRNKTEFSSNLQFVFDAKEAGFEVKDLGDVTKIDENHYEWETPFGTLREYDHILTLTKSDD